eukprot:TRINITY_DN9283_c3_g2_i3.p4 TRINITY_DN9283_c3_g2~~TRINITY_DN9283_c3_g2_i3.p4  ORF type:complete len:155 (-),score=4.64 TRINITY_DN9283_c3_g2_i3:699-1163(-)
MKMGCILICQFVSYFDLGEIVLDRNSDVSWLNLYKQCLIFYAAQNFENHHFQEMFSSYKFQSHHNLQMFSSYNFLVFGILKINTICRYFQLQFFYGFQSFEDHHILEMFSILIKLFLFLFLINLKKNNNNQATKKFVYCKLRKICVRDQLFKIN